MSQETETAAGHLAHTVYFTLIDSSLECIDALKKACQHYLSEHDGTEYFAVGTLVPDLQRPVNDQDYHVSLHVHFQDRASHDQYQTDPRHLQFIEENKSNWSQVRVFDSYLS